MRTLVSRSILLSYVFIVTQGLDASNTEDRYLSVARPPSAIHLQFLEHYPGGSEKFFDAIRERSDWSPLQKFEFMKESDPPRWTNDHHRFDSLGPVIQCPDAIFEKFGQGDGEKRICGRLNQNNNCVVISVGSNNQWDFEVAVATKYPNCRIHTFDCTVNAIVPELIKSQVTFYPICLGINDIRLSDGKEFRTWSSIARKIGLTHPPTALKMDIEGFEWTSIPAIIKSNFLVPESFSFELHYITSMTQLPWYGRSRSDPEIGLFIELLHSLGYVLVDRHDNPFCPSCTEIVTAKLLHTNRFRHQGGDLQSFFEVNPGASGVVQGPLGTLPYPTVPDQLN